MNAQDTAVQRRDAGVSHQMVGERQDRRHLIAGEVGGLAQEAGIRNGGQEGRQPLVASRAHHGWAPGASMSAKAAWAVAMGSSGSLS
jgi:hypothetical protein